MSFVAFFIKNFLPNFSFHIAVASTALCTGHYVTPQLNYLPYKNRGLPQISVSFPCPWPATINSRLWWRAYSKQTQFKTSDEPARVKQIVMLSFWREIYIRLTLCHYSIKLPSLQKQRAAPNLRFVSMSLASYHHPQVIGEFDLLGYLTLNDTLHYGLLQLSAKIDQKG